MASLRFGRAALRRSRPASAARAGGKVARPVVAGVVGPCVGGVDIDVEEVGEDQGHFIVGRPA